MEGEKEKDGPFPQGAGRVTTIGSKPKVSRVLQPTAIPSQVVPTASGTQRKPTAIGPSAIKPQPAKAETPTAITGVTRQRIPASLKDLRGLQGNASDKTLEMALHLVLTFNVEEADDTRCIFWGQQTQTDYSALIGKCLEMSQSALLQLANTRLARLQEILADIDLESLLETGTGLVAKFLGKGREKILEDFTETQSEITLLIEALKNDIPKLLELKQKLAGVKEDIQALSSKLQAEAMAAEFITGFMRKRGQSGNDKRLADILEGRCMALTSTTAQICSSDSMFEIQIDHPIKLIGCIQNTALIQVPAWLGSYMGLKMMFERNTKPTKTHISEVGHQLKQLIQSFRP